MNRNDNEEGDFLNQYIEQMKNRLINEYKPKGIFLFGSYAWGTPDDESDVDLVIIVEQTDEKPQKRISRALKALHGIPVSKDILVYTQVEFDRISSDKSSLLYRIKIEGVKLYEAA